MDPLHGTLRLSFALHQHRSITCFSTIITAPGYCLRRTPPAPPRGWVGQRPKKFCVPEIGVKFPAPLINFIFCLRKNFLMWVGGWVGRPELARAPNHPHRVLKQ